MFLQTKAKEFFVLHSSFFVSNEFFTLHFQTNSSLFVLHSSLKFPK
ncbi:Uncharacterised protein [Segatella copri]|nr:Uncharacterised protein [Segatella copri]